MFRNAPCVQRLTLGGGAIDTGAMTLRVSRLPFSRDPPMAEAGRREPKWGPQRWRAVESGSRPPTAGGRSASVAFRRADERLSSCEAATALPRGTWLLSKAYCRFA